MIRALLSVAAIVWVIFGVFLLVSLSADAYGKSPTDPNFGWEIWFYATGTDIGQAWLVSIAVMIVVSAILPTIADKSDIIGVKNTSRRKLLYFVAAIAVLLPLDRMLNALISATNQPEKQSPSWILTGSDIPPEPVLPGVLGVWSFSLFWAVLLVILSLALIFRHHLMTEQEVVNDFQESTRAVLTILLIALVAFASFGFLQRYQVFSFPISVALSFVWLLGIPILINYVWGYSLKRRLFLAMFLLTALPYIVYFTPVYRWILEVPTLRLLLPLALAYIGWLLYSGFRNQAYSSGQKITALVIPTTGIAGFGLLVSLSNILLVSDWFSALGRDWSVDLLKDQQSAGVLIFTVAATFAIVGAVIIRFNSKREI